ncbi:MAG: hypothetical protein GTO41_04700 [Burkholderiales bacterium]|nr:hypothetical protein [Burkholderiales bacterium]
MDRHITPDLTPITTTLELLEYRTAAMDAKLTKFVPGFIEEVERASRHSDRNKELPRVLGAKLYGTKDNLQLLNGVTPTLERLLNANGVHYFWQIAEWDEVDIAAIDKRLLSFRGRVEQYDWVNQAKRLVRMTDPGGGTEEQCGGGKRI